MLYRDGTGVSSHFQRRSRAPCKAGCVGARADARWRGRIGQPFPHSCDPL